jgi:hypothetical protein
MCCVTHSGETWYRLRNWQGSQAEEERMSGQILAADGYESIDPSHPLGGPDTGKDARCKKDGDLWIMAAYYSRGERTLREIEDKLVSDIESARKHSPVGVAFVTNQELRLAERVTLEECGGDLKVDIFHLERIAHILDQPSMGPVRQQYLGIGVSAPPLIIKAEVLEPGRRFSRTDELLEIMKAIKEESVRSREKELHDRRHQRPAAIDQGFMNQLVGLPRNTPPPRSKPWTEAEIEEHLAQHSAALEGRWQQCMEYLASIAWPALRFRLTNEAKSFLKNVEVILTFEDVVGVDYHSIEKFDWSKLDDPSRKQSRPHGMMVYEDTFQLMKPNDYPVSWENQGNNLIVTIWLAELRPYPPKEIEGNDIVLVVRNPDLKAVNIKWTATAEGYGDYLEGPQIQLPIIQDDALEAVHSASKAAQDA